MSLYGGESRALAAALLTILWGGAGCEMPRPSETYVAKPLSDPQRMVSDAGVFEDDGPDDDVRDIFDEVPGEGSDEQAGEGESDNPLAALEGDYYFRIDTELERDGAQLGTVTTRTTTYGQTRIKLVDGQLLGEERLCHTDTRQEVSASGASVKTEVADKVPAALESVVRSFDVDLDAGTWSTDAVKRRQGWKSNLMPDEMPTDPNQADKFRDPDGDGVAGVSTRVTGMVSSPVRGSLTCEYDLVSYSVTAYERGKLGDQGLFKSADIDVVEDEVFALFATKTGGNFGQCDVDTFNDPSPEKTLRDELVMKRVPDVWLDNHDKCAPKGQFDAML